MVDPSYVLVTHQPGAIGMPEWNVYGPESSSANLTKVGRLLAAGATPPMAAVVVPVQPASFDDL